MRKIAKDKEQDGAEIDLTPMLDVVFIMLIFFIVVENRRVDIRAVRANIQRLLAEDPEAPVTIKVEKGAEAGIVVDVADAARESGVAAVNWASDR
jgi:biopolymer transport protein ExbD